MTLKRLIVDVGLFGQVSIPPVYVSSEIGLVSADVIRVTISEVLDHNYTPSVLAFALSGTLAEVDSVTMYAGQAYFDLNLNQNAAKSDVISLFYTQPSIDFLRNLVGGKVLPFGPELVTNNIDSVNVPSPLKAASRSTTEIFLSWNGITEADSYIVQRDIDNTFPSPSSIYSGPNLTFLDSGLLIDTTYYYRVKAVSNNPAKLDSDWITASTKTLSILPALWYETTGLKADENNDYGQATSVSLDSMKSVVNALGPTATPIDANQKSIQRFGSVQIATNVTKGPNLCQYDFAAPITLGDFTYIMNIKYGTAAVRGLFGNSVDTGQIIAMDNASRCSVTITGTKYRLDLLTPTLDKYEFIIVQRTGTDIRISRDAGQTWDETMTCKTDDLILDYMFNSPGASNFVQGLGRTVFMPAALTQAQIQEVIDYEKQPAFTPDVVTEDTIEVLGVTYQSLTNNYLTGQNLRPQLGNYRRSFPIYTVADKSFIVAMKPAADQYEDVIYVFDHATGQISEGVDMGLNGGIDSHCYGGVFEYDRRIIHQEVDYHYDEGADNSLVIKTTGKNFDLGSIKRTQLNNGISNEVFAKSNYYGFQKFSDGSVYLVHQEYNGAGGNRYINVAKSTDGLNSWDNYKQIIDTEANSRWAYPYMTYNDYNDEMLLFINLFNQPASKFDYVFLLRSDDGLLWKNMEGTFEKNIDVGNFITWAELLANCIVVDASGETDSCRCHNVHINSSGEIFGYVGNGDNTFSVIKGTPGSSFALTPITWDGHTPVTSRDIEGGYITINGNQIDIYHLEDQGGNNQAIHIRSTDNGANWSFINTLTTANYNHVDIIGTANQGNNNLIATIYDNAGIGTPFFLEI